MCSCVQRSPTSTHFQALTSDLHRSTSSCHRRCRRHHRHRRRHCQCRPQPCLHCRQLLLPLRRGRIKQQLMHQALCRHRHRQRNATPHQKVRPALNPHRNPHQARKGGKEQPENNSNRNMSLCSYLPSPGPDQGGCSQLRGSHGPASGSSATRARIVIRTRPI